MLFRDVPVLNSLEVSPSIPNLVPLTKINAITKQSAFRDAA